MVAHNVTPLGGRTCVILSFLKPVHERAVIHWSNSVTQDDMCGNLFAQGRETSVLIGKNIETHSVIGQHSNVYILPTNSINGSTVSCDFFGRRVVVRIFTDADVRTLPVYAVLHEDNAWMMGMKDSEWNDYTIPEAYFYNMAQLKAFVSQSSIITLGSAYQIFLDQNGVMLSDILQRINNPTRNFSRVWLKVRRNMPTNFVNPNNPAETIVVFPLESETFPRASVMAATPSIGRNAGSDTLDLRRFQDWRAVVGKKMGRPLSTWVR